MGKKKIYFSYFPFFVFIFHLCQEKDLIFLNKFLPNKEKPKNAIVCKKAILVILG